MFVYDGIGNEILFAVFAAILLIDNACSREWKRDRIWFASLLPLFIAIVSAAIFWLLWDYGIISYSGSLPYGQSGVVFAFVGIVFAFKISNSCERRGTGVRKRLIDVLALVFAILFGPVYFILEFWVNRSISPRIVHTASIGLGLLSGFLFIQYEEWRRMHSTRS